MNITAGISIFTGVVLSTTVAHSAVVTYPFSGTALGIGTTVSGFFSIDYCAINSGSSTGTYRSNASALIIEIGTHSISSSSSTSSEITVDNSFFPDANFSQDFVIFNAAPLDSNQPNFLILTFFDPTGEALTSTQLPASAAELNAFPSISLEVIREDFGIFGELFELDITFESVPEPSSSILLLSGIVGLAIRRKRSS